MKRNPILWLACAMVFSTLVAYVLAQQTAPASKTDKLENAIALLNDGKAQEAKDLIARIYKGDPDYARAQCYQALCLYALKDKRAFLETLSPEEVLNAVPAQIREDVWFKQIDAFRSCGEFRSLARKIAEFQTNYTSSAHLPAIREYRLVGLYDHGMKRSKDATRHEGEVFQDIWSEAITNLQEFLVQAAGFASSNYTVFPKRVLKEEIWLARMTLGDGDAVLEEIPIEDVTSREKFGLLRVQFYLKMRPEEIDENLQRLANHMREFPNPTNPAPVELAAAVLNFRKGKNLCLEAEAAEKTGNLSAGTGKRRQAADYFNTQRTMEQRLRLNQSSGIGSTKLLEIREDLLYSYVLEKNYESLFALTSSIVAESKSVDLNWILAKVYQGIALTEQPSPRLKEAAAVLDEVLEAGFDGGNQRDRLLTAAAKWRVHLWLTLGEKQKAQELVQRVQDSDCRRNYKVAFVNAHKGLLIQSNAQPKAN